MHRGISTTKGAFPEFGMSEVPRVELREQGIVVIPFMHSISADPKRREPHYHEFFQMFVLQGRAAVMHDFHEFRAEGTTLVFLSPGQVHTAVPEPGMTGTTISFTQEFFDNHAPPPSRIFDYPFFFPTEVMPWLDVRPEDSVAVMLMFNDLQREFDAGLDGAAEVLRAMLHILLVRVNRLYAKAHPQKEVTRAELLVRRFYLAVEQHFREFQNVGQYARLLGVTANHLNDTMHDLHGKAAGEVIRQRRLLDAKRLLSHSEMSVSEIGYHLGFEDPSYFSRFFRRYEHCAPAEFREQIREKYP
jgi:AraC-like DNA-binding protein